MLHRERQDDRPSRNWWRSALLVALTALVVAPLTAYAGDSFSDVPDSNIFHDDIDWMADNGVTRGCGGDRFCPDDPVTREQMSAFMRRLQTEGVFATPGDLDAFVSFALGENNDAFDAFIPIATFSQFGEPSAGARPDTVSFRTPVTGAPTFSDATGPTYLVDLPGLQANPSDHIVICGGNGSIGTKVNAAFSGGDVQVQVRDNANAPTDLTITGITCTVYKS